MPRNSPVEKTPPLGCVELSSRLPFGQRDKLLILELLGECLTFHTQGNTGMYAFICMPEYAPLQWHPFTITSGEDDHTVNFLISGIGDWTQEPSRRRGVCVAWCDATAARED